MKVKDCSICFKAIKRLNRVVTGCDHIFHFTCLFKNLKYNRTTGDCCPLCRKSFLPSNGHQVADRGEVRNGAQPILARRYPGIPRYYHFDHPVRAVTATNGHINRIIQHRQIREQRIQSMLVENNREVGSERDRTSKYIRDLSFHELKSKLKEKGLSARGYLRTSLEERLYKSMRR